MDNDLDNGIDLNCGFKIRDSWVINAFKQFFFVILMFSFIISCNNPSSKITGSVSLRDSLDFNNNWANITDHMLYYKFPNFFPEIDGVSANYLSYYYCGFNENPKVDSNETVLKVLIGRAFHPSILLKIFKMDSLYYFEAKINNSAGNFGRVQFHITKEISDSAFHSYFKSIQEMNFFNFKPNPVNEGINDGSGYFVEVNVRGKHHYVIRLTPYLIKENQIRPNQNELVEINQLCDRLFELSGCREVFEPIY